MKRLGSVLVSIALFHTGCGDDGAAEDEASAARASTSATTAGAGSTPSAAGSGGDASGGPGAGGGAQGAGGDASASSGNGASSGAGGHVEGEPIVGGPGCGFDPAAFCDPFDGPSARRGRGGELDARFWSAGRMQGQLSTTRAIGVGMALIPTCRPDVADRVWPDGDTIVCDPVPDVASPHLLIAAAAQYYGQNGYRVRQPFDFAGRTGTIAFSGTASPQGPLHGWLSLAITEEPISMPGYAILGNDEGSIIPRNAVEVHFNAAGGSNDDAITIRHIHVFRDWVDTVFAPPEALPASTYLPGKLNHFEVAIAEDHVEVRISPYSDDGTSFGAPTTTWRIDTPIPFTRGYVHLSLHNHATIKYTQPIDGFAEVVDAAVARIDDFGFDGPVVTAAREHEIPDALVPFNEPGFQGPERDPHNPEHAGVDLGYFLNDASLGPRQTLSFPDVDTSGVASAKVALSWWVDALTPGQPETFALRLRLNGGEWIERALEPGEVALFTENPTTIDPDGEPIGDPHTQGRLAIVVDVPVEDLVSGDNALELVTSGVPTSYPPFVGNIDLLLATE
jgi:hypothetical protein